MPGKRSTYVLVVVAILSGLLLAAFAPTAALAAGSQSIAIQDNVDDPDDDGEDVDDEFEAPEDNPFCEDGTVLEHPVAAAIAADEDYGVTYEDVMIWFCDDGFGFGQILLALQTAIATERPDDDAQYYLDLRMGIDDSDGWGWGQIWQDEGLIGRPEDAGPPGKSGDAPTVHAGPPGGEPPGQSGDAPPGHAGPPGGEPPGRGPGGGHSDP